MRTHEQDFNTRMRQGREYEAKMIARLIADGHTVVRATEQQDKHDKVDIIFNGYRAQLKRRETGEDIIVEVERPLNKLGRDVAGKAQVFIEFKADGSYTVVLAKQLKQAALALAAAARQEWRNDLSGSETYSSPVGVVRCRRDAGSTGPAAGCLKIMAYVKYNAAYCRHFQ